MNRHYLRGQTLFRQNRYAEAIEELRLARSEDPDNPWVASQLALALVHTDRGAEAAEIARDLIARAPDEAQAHHILSLVELNRGRAREAEIAIRRALSLDPDDADTHGLLARARLEQDHAADALAAADAGLALDPGNDLCLTFRSHALLTLGRHEEAAAVNTRLLELDPTDAHSHTLRGEELVRSGRPAEAFPHFREALRLNPHHPGARYNFAQCLKARSPLYGILLRTMIRLGTINLWTLITLALVVVVGLDLLAKSLHDPAWATIVVSIRLGIITFCVLGSVASQLYDILLWADPEGRPALSPAEARAARWNLACFVFAAAFFFLGSLVKNPSKLYLMAMGSLFLTRIVSEIFEATPGYVRRRMAWIGVVSALCIFISPALLFFGLVLAIQWKNPQILPLVLKGSLLVGLIPLLVSGFADDIRQWFERRRPDAS